METVQSLISSSSSRYASAFAEALAPETLQEHTPAVFAPTAEESLSPAYTFISTRRVLDALGQAGFVPVAARQMRCRRRSALHACHIIRLRRRYETVALRDSIPELSRADGNSGNHE